MLSRPMCSLTEIHTPFENIRDLQKKDKNINLAIKLIKLNKFDNIKTPIRSKKLETLWKIRKCLKIKINVLYRIANSLDYPYRERVVIPICLVLYIIDSIHQKGHLRYEKILNKLQRICY